MSSQHYPLNSILDVRTFFEDEEGAFITTAAGKATVQRISDDEYWTGTGLTFQAASTSITLTKTGDTNSPGQWKFNPILDTNGLTEDTYIFVFRDSNDIAVNDPLYFSAVVGEIAVGGTTINQAPIIVTVTVGTRLVTVTVDIVCP